MGRIYNSLEKDLPCPQRLQKKTKVKCEILPDNGYFKTDPHSSVVQYYLKRKRKFNGNEMI
jgi:hypothetical protein